MVWLAARLRPVDAETIEWELGLHPSPPRDLGPSGGSRTVAVMRARRGLILGWSVVAAYSGLLAWTAIRAVAEPDRDRSAPVVDEAPERFVIAWERSREATFVATGTYERHSDVTGATLSSEDVVAQRPPRRLHRQLGGVDGRDDDRLIVCPAPPVGDEDAPAPCRLGPPGGATYEETVRREVEGLRSLTQGNEPLYRVRESKPGCFDLELLRIDPRAPFGVQASFCFDAETGAPSARRVHHEGGIIEVLAVTSIRTDVTLADLEP